MRANAILQSFSRSFRRVWNRALESNLLINKQQLPTALCLKNLCFNTRAGVQYSQFVACLVCNI